MKNIGNQVAWGSVSYRLKGREPQGFDVPGLGPNSGWHHYIISLKGAYLNPKSDDVPEVTTNWEKLYTK